MTKLALLSNEAVALGALHAGVTASYAYPGTPSTEILEYLINEYQKGGPLAAWSTNEKTALEAALGVSFAGRRTLVAMKHVGLNVAADPFINSSLLDIKGGLVLVVADDPGMHSSQNEQDTRYYAAFGMVPCLEPRSEQESYDMTKEAFELSEKYGVPVILRMVTRLSHARAEVVTGEIRKQNPVVKSTNKQGWLLLPSYSIIRYDILIEKQKELTEWSNNHSINKLILDNGIAESVIITSGVAGNYYYENLTDLKQKHGGVSPNHLHIGAYPLPTALITKLCAAATSILIIEEGMPFLEEKMVGILPQKIAIHGKLDGTLPRSGELDPDNVRVALGLPSRAVLNIEIPPLANRPPQLCKGCPHADSYDVIKSATAGVESFAITADIGCYALGALPPYSVPDTIVCMGASVNMARGASDAGIKYAIGVIGDSTFLHSGITPLIDAISANTPMILVILDNSIVAMTGCQETMLPSGSLPKIVEGLGVPKEHIHVLEALKTEHDNNVAIFKQAMEYRGLSVVIFTRVCIEAFRALRNNPKFVENLNASKKNTPGASL